MTEIRGTDPPTNQPTGDGWMSAGSSGGCRWGFRGCTQGRVYAEQTDLPEWHTTSPPERERAATHMTQKTGCGGSFITGGTWRVRDGDKKSNPGLSSPNFSVCEIFQRFIPWSHGHGLVNDGSDCVKRDEVTRMNILSCLGDEF